MKKELERINQVNYPLMILKMCENIPEDLYDEILCVIQDINGNLDIDYKDIDNNIKSIEEDFKKIENAEICFN